MATQSTTKALPKWLIAAQSHPHLVEVLATLVAREQKRDVARNASRRAASPSSLRARVTSVRIPKIHPSRQQVDHYSIAVGARPDNNPFNRYYQLEPYDRTRVIVNEDVDRGEHKKADRTGGRYLNANWVLEREGHKWWIATQAPLPHTAHAFLSVILQPIARPPQALLGAHTIEAGAETSRVRTVIQLTQNVESGRTKAHAYFPNEVGQSLIVPPEPGLAALALKVTLLKTEDIPEAHCIRSTVSVVPITQLPVGGRVINTFGELVVDDGDKDDYGEETDEKITFQHLLYSTWPDHGVPSEEDRNSLFHFLKLVDRTNRDISLFPHADNTLLDPDPPIMVGCSAGIGRTGSFIAQSSLLRSFGFLAPASSPTPSSVLPPSPLGPLPAPIKDDLVAQEVDSLREQRPGMVQRDDQVLLIYQILVDAYHDEHESFE